VGLRSFVLFSGILVVQLMKLVLEKLLIWKLCLILGDQRRRQRTAEGIFDNFILFAGAQEYADRRLFVRLAHIAVKGFQIKVQLTEMLRFKAPDLEFKGDQGVETAMKEEQV
jgi:hypothetical protein